MIKDSDNTKSQNPSYLDFLLPTAASLLSSSFFFFIPGFFPHPVQSRIFASLTHLPNRPRRPPACSNPTIPHWPHPSPKPVPQPRLSLAQRLFSHAVTRWIHYYCHYYDTIPITLPRPVGMSGIAGGEDVASALFCSVDARGEYTCVGEKVITCDIFQWFRAIGLSVPPLTFETSPLSDDVWAH